MDAEILQLFIEEAEGYLPEICSGITAYWQDPNDVEKLKIAHRQAHTLKGAAKMVGLNEIGELGRELEFELEKVISSKNVLTSQQNQFLLERISKLELTLNLARESFNEICTEDEALNEDFFGELELQNTVATPPPEEITTIDEAKEVEVATEIPEVGEYIAIADAADDYRLDLNSVEEIELKEPEVIELNIFEEFDVIELDNLDEVEAIKVEVLEPETTEEPKIVAKPAEETEAQADEKIEAQANISEADEWDTDDFEIDAEMLEIFALEAEDLIRNISSNLTVLEQKPNNREALLEIRRSAHTLKGSAGIVGFRKISDLAHRVEDLLDYIAENKIPSNKNIIEVLLASTDCLEALTNGKTSSKVDSKIIEIYQRFDEILASLQKQQESKNTAVSAPAVDIPAIHPTVSENTINETKAPKLPNSELPAPETPLKKAELPALPIELEIEAPKLIPPSVPVVISEKKEAHKPQTAENNQQLADPQDRSVVRVSLERLDDLVKLVNEMVISRSVFGQRLSELEYQIHELQLTTNRLRHSTGKLEIDFEANTLSNSVSNFQNRSFASANFNKPASDKREFDSLEFDNYTEFHQTTRELVEAASDTSAIRNEFDNLLGELNSIFDNQRRLVGEMQDNLLRLRMVPLKSVAARLHRTVRVTANEEGKQVELEIKNGDIEIDTQILDCFIEPLIHLLRNAVAHGIEPPETRRLLGKLEKGKITLRTHSEGTHIVFTISDDGRGIAVSSLKEKAIAAGFINSWEAKVMANEDAYSLIFLPGLSTADEVNQVSGRGVGMNVVKANITRRQGTISIKSEAQKGATFTVRMPMSFAVTRAMMVKANDQTFAFPLKIAKQVVEVSPAELERIMKEGTYKLDGVSYKFYEFNRLLNFPARARAFNNRIPLLLLETSETPYALLVDQLLKPEEIVIKPLGGLLQNLSEVVGATILGDGKVVPVLDLIHLLENKIRKTGNVKKPFENAEIQDSLMPRQLSVLIVDDSPSVRQMNSNLIKNADWIPVMAKDGLEALELLHTSGELPDVILTDVEMPRMDGYEFLAAIKREELLREIPVIMITSRAGEKHRRKAFDLGVSDYLTKPYEESVLREKISILAAKAVSAALVEK